MAERQQAGVAQQQVERHREDREAQRLRDEDGIDAHEGRDDQDRQRDDPGDLAGALRALAEPVHHFSFPNRPAGRIISTMAMMKNTTTLDASG